MSQSWRGCYRREQRQRSEANCQCGGPWETKRLPGKIAINDRFVNE